MPVQHREFPTFRISSCYYNYKPVPEINELSDGLQNTRFAILKLHEIYV
jgi:hypothetical protein